MTKTEREAWDEWVTSVHKHIDSPSMEDSVVPLVIPMDVYVRKLERELQALKHKKAVAAILQKKV